LGLPEMTTTAQRADWWAFLVDTEGAYAKEMRNYVRKDLKTHALIMDTQMSYGNPGSFKREADSDFADDHAYWQHPNFPGSAWDFRHWDIRNTPMTASLAAGEGGEFATLAANRVAGKPYTITEYSHPAPSDYQAEMYPLFATFAALQDWDGIFQFDFGDYGRGDPHTHIQGFFGMQGNPAKEALAPAAAVLFRNGLIAPIASKATLHLPPTAPYGMLEAKAIWRTLSNNNVPDLFSHRLETLIDPLAKSPKVVLTKVAGRQFVKVITGHAGPQFVAFSDYAVVATGFLGGQTIECGPVRMDVPEFGNNFASLMLVSLDGKPIAKSERLLLSVIGKAENTAMVWNATRTSVGAYWGRGPALAEGIPIHLTIAGSALRHAYGLDAAGARERDAPVSVVDGNATFSFGPDLQTVWYELAP
jgi:hypothetical protein